MPAGSAPTRFHTDSKLGGKQVSTWRASQPRPQPVYSKRKKMGWPKPSHLSGAIYGLKEELHGQLDYSSAVFDRRLAEVCIGLCNRSSRRILFELESQVAAVGERIQRMVQEVIGLNPELHLFRLRNGEVLEQRQVGVEIPRSVGHREKSGPVLANRGGGGETIPVDVLV